MLLREHRVLWREHWALCLGLVTHVSFVALAAKLGDAQSRSWSSLPPAICGEEVCVFACLGVHTAPSTPLFSSLLSPHSLFPPIFLCSILSSSLLSP